MTFAVYHSCEQVMEINEAFKSASRDFMKMNHTRLKLLNVGLPNPSYSDKKFIGKEDYMKKLQNTMNFDLGNLPEETTLERIASCIKPLLTFNATMDKLFASYNNIFSKYALLMRL